MTVTLAACSGGSGEGDDLGGAPSNTGGGDAAGGTGGTGSGSGGDSGSGACSGTFQTAELFFQDVDRVTTPALSGDELELFYAMGPSGAERFYSSRRDSKVEAFPAGTPVAELNAQCDDTLDRSLDVSEDGLTLYYSCYLTLEEPTELYAATRETRDDPFGTGTVVGSATPSSSVEDGGLSLLWSGEVTASTKLSSRESTTEGFGEGVALNGLATTNLFAPDLAADGRAVFGAVTTASGRSLAVATRVSTTADFGEPVVLESLLVGLPNSGAPELSADCRSLYFVGVTQESVFAFYRSTRE